MNLNPNTRLLLIIILAFAFFTRALRVHIPEKYIFDEVYHAVTAKLIANNDNRAFEWWNSAPEKDTAVDWLHPPLAKYTQALGMIVFGQNSFGWRSSSVIFGTGVILLTFILAKELFAKDSLALLAAFLASLDGLLLVQSRIAMNDIHVTFFILLSLILFLKYTKKPTWSLLIITAVSIGLAMASKWSGLFVLIIIGVSRLSLGIWEIKQTKIKLRILKLKRLIFDLLILATIPFLIYVSSYFLMFAQGKTFFCHQEQQIQGECYWETFKLGDEIIYQGYVSHFVELHQQIIHYQTHLNATHPYQSRPIQWFLNLKPVWVDVKFSENQITNIYALGNPLLFWLGDVAIIISIFYSGLWISDRLRKDEKGMIFNFQSSIFNLFFLVFSYFLVWLPWQFSPRIMFFYHYTPAVPLLAINLAYWLEKLKKLNGGKEVYQLLVFCLLALFFIFYPHWTLMSVPKAMENIYFAFASWR